MQTTETVILSPDQVAYCASEAYRRGSYEEQNEILRGIFRAECMQAARNAAACNATAPAPTDLKANQPTEHEK